MDEITLKNFRCFRKKQTARLAPLTLLVGENSTGKTSFMAMIRALADVAHAHRVPDFTEEPYDLGSFDEIAHYRGGRCGQAETFEAGFKVKPRTGHGERQRPGGNGQPYHVHVTFKKKGTAPFPVKIRLSHEETWVEVRLRGRFWRTRFGTPGGAWELSRPIGNAVDAEYSVGLPLIYLLEPLMGSNMFEDRARPIASQGTGLPTDNDRKRVEWLTESYRQRISRYERGRPYASAPVRSRPRRTYDPPFSIRDPESDYVPMHLASTYFQNQGRWKEVQGALEGFGKAAGLFDEVSVKPPGRRNGEPFQVQIRQSGNRAKGPPRNLIDMDWGVSQMLPVITELLRPDAPSMFLLQQPEVHLHPSAQAALGSLFCQVSSPACKLVVETHSDHLLDRVRMDVRDGKSPLKPEDISILFFERGGLDVHIHSIRTDTEGNILGAPSDYRRFFLDETMRSLRF